MNKSSLVALSLGLLAVLSCLDPVVHAKPNVCCVLKLPYCCSRVLQDSLSARVKRHAKAIAVKSTLLGSLHDARAGVDHAGVQAIEESYPRA